jgi:hypothetical protein
MAALTYSDAAAASESQRESDRKSGVTEATATQAHYVRLMQLSVTWGVRNGAFGALKQLGLDAGIQVPAGYTGG